MSINQINADRLKSHLNSLANDGITPEYVYSGPRATLVRCIGSKWDMPFYGIISDMVLHIQTPASVTIREGTLKVIIEPLYDAGETQLSYLQPYIVKEFANSLSYTDCTGLHELTRKPKVPELGYAYLGAFHYSGKAGTLSEMEVNPQYLLIDALRINLASIETFSNSTYYSMAKTKLLSYIDFVSGIEDSQSWMDIQDLLFKIYAYK